MDNLASFTTVLQLVAFLVWNCVHNAYRTLKNAMFDVLLTSQDLIEGILSRCGVQFAEGLFDALQAPNPPDFSFFKSLQNIVGKLWAVYAICMEKTGQRPILYFGQSCDIVEGVRSRLRHYDSEYMRLPRFVKQALKEGFRITHKGLLCWAPKPAHKDYAWLNMCIVGLEATFSFFFWSMKSRTADYRMPHALRWDPASFMYDGACSHSPLREKLKIDGLSPEQCAEKYKQAELNRREREKAYKAAVYRADPELSKEKSRVKAKQQRENDKATKKHRCDPCDSWFVNKPSLQKHLNSEKHREVIGRGRPKTLKRMYMDRHIAKNSAAKRFYCAICDHVAGTNQRLQVHLNSKRHIDKATAYAQAIPESPA